MTKQILIKKENPIRLQAVDKGYVDLGIRIDGLVHWRDIARLARQMAAEANKAKKIEFHLRSDPFDPERDLAQVKEKVAKGIQTS